jgi:hypothetical protein
MHNPPDRDAQINAQVGVLLRREIEARILAPLVQALSAEFGEERVLPVLQRTIVDIARQQGAGLASSLGGSSLEDFAHGLKAWKAGGALEMDVLEQGPEALSFNVTRCRYAELYRELGIPELGALLSCGRDSALIEGFSKDVKLERSRTIMEGAEVCTFRYRRKP